MKLHRVEIKTGHLTGSITVDGKEIRATRVELDWSAGGIPQLTLTMNADTTIDGELQLWVKTGPPTDAR